MQFAHKALFVRKTSRSIMRVSRMLKSSSWHYSGSISDSVKYHTMENHQKMKFIIQCKSISSWRSILARLKLCQFIPLLWAGCCMSNCASKRGCRCHLLSVMSLSSHKNEWYSISQNVRMKRKTEEVQSRDKFIWMHREQGEVYEVMRNEWQMSPTQFIVRSLYRGGFSV